MTKRIAIVGGGAAGLAAAFALRHRARLTLYEAQAHTGGHARTVQARHNNQTLSADIGFMVYNRRNYPTFCRLLQQLGIAGAPTSMSFSLAHDGLNLAYNGGSFGGLLAQPRNLARPLFWRLLASILRFNRIAKRAAAGDISEQQTLGDFLSRHRFSALLSEAYLLPMGAAIWSCAPAQLAQAPARFILDFFNNHGLLDLTNRPQWLHIPGGSATYTAALIRAIPDLIVRRHAVTAISPAAPAADSPAAAVISDSAGEQHAYDAVIIAAHAPDALALLSAPNAAQRDILSAFRVNHSRAILHTDVALLPPAPRAHAAWNYRICADASGAAHSSVTYHLSKLQHLPAAAAPLLLTLGVPARAADAIAPPPPRARPNPAAILGEYDFAHPLPDAAALQAQKRFDDINQQGALFFCGAYWRNGFHEDAVTSGQQAAAHAARHLHLPPAAA